MFCQKDNMNLVAVINRLLIAFYESYLFAQLLVCV